jgi:hypothetical protein
MKKLLMTTTVLLALAAPASATVIFPSSTGIACDNTCINFQPGDSTYVLFNGEPWPILTILSGAYTLVTDTEYHLTVNGQTLNFAFNDPHYSIDAGPTPDSFVPGSFRLLVQGLPSSIGFAGPQFEEFCPVTPGVPEPATWAMMLLGFMGLGFVMKRKAFA